MKPIIQVFQLSKSYYIIPHRTRYLSLRDSINNIFKKNDGKEIFWALKNINFEVSQGEAIGIIGRNGAGKSTLLKLLSRITYPTSGCATINGRLASLLEVGTGFHPELTGRENIFLNGAILGLKKHEIKRQFDNIVEFSGVQQFIETPLKNFSSGMQMRLAFAVAAHLETDILLLDEVLAVGDKEFQEKCIGKMNNATKNGRTILFVSHNLGAVRNLCNKAIVLDKGQISIFDETNTSISFYTRQLSQSSMPIWINHYEKNNKALLEKIEICNIQGEHSNHFLTSEEIVVNFYIQTFQKLSNFSIGFDLIKNGITVFRTRQLDSIKKNTVIAGEKSLFICKIPAWLLNEGEYSIKPNMAIFFTEYLSNAYQDVEMPIYISMDAARSSYHTALNSQNQPGVIFPTLTWQHESR